MILPRIMPDQLSKVSSVRKIKRLESIDETISWMFECCRDIGADKMSYHFYSDNFSCPDNDTLFFSRGYSENWVLRYESHGLKNSDPIPPTVMQHGRIMTWGEAIAKSNLSSDELRFINEAREAGLMHGIGLPVWGPDSCDAFVAVGMPKPVRNSAGDRFTALQILLQAGHQRICQLTAQINPKPKLSPREVEILTWVARGKSNTDIGTILGLSPDTVSTYLQRIFGKLGSRNRIGAAIRALKLGLIRV